MKIIEPPQMKLMREQAHEASQNPEAFQQWLQMMAQTVGGPQTVQMSPEAQKAAQAQIAVDNLWRQIYLTRTMEISKSPSISVDQAHLNELVDGAIALADTVVRKAKEAGRI